MNSITRRAGALKVVLIIAVVLVLLIALLVGGGIYLVSTQMNSFAKTAIESGGTYALGVPTTVRQVDLKMFKGTFAMEGFNVANPEGYNSTHFVDLGTSNVSVNYSTFGSAALVIPEMRFSSIDLNLEKKSGKANYQAILDNLKKFDKAEGGKPNPAPTKSEPFQYVINKIIVEDISIHADLLPVGGELTRQHAEIDKIVLKNVGSAGKPVDTGELVAIVTQAILEAVAQGALDLPADILTGLGSGLGDLTDLGDMGIGVAAEIGGQLTNIAGDIGEQATEAVENATDQLEGAAEEAGKAVEDAAKEIGNLLGGGGDKKDKK